MNAFKIFLSHRYKSPKENLFFFDLFSEMKIAELQFEVDGWNNETQSLETKPTNVTRLERMVRGTHGFLGIYPFPGALMTVPTREQLIKESSYFRLELDLAIRSRKPALICFDDRYRNVLPLPPGLRTCDFDAQEVLAGAASPSAGGFATQFKYFCDEVAASLAFESTRPSGGNAHGVGLLLSTSNDADAGYRQDHVRIIESLVGERNDVIPFSWPPVFDRQFFTKLVDLDWIIIDVGDDPVTAAVAAYLHGRFIPTMRLKRIFASIEEDQASALEKSLFGGVEVGYRKDVLRWHTDEDLYDGLRSRLARIEEPAFRISSRALAKDYFQTAAQRKEVVFLSYSGADFEVARRISVALKKRFKDVFDYKDGESIEPGQSWLKDIFDKLSRAAIAVPLLSNTYADSGNCMHEAEEIVALHDARKLQLLPVNLDPTLLSESAKEKLSFMRSTQYLSYPALQSDPDALAQRIVQVINASRH